MTKKKFFPVSPCVPIQVIILVIDTLIEMDDSLAGISWCFFALAPLAAGERANEILS